MGVVTIRLGASLCNLGILRVPKAIPGQETPLIHDEQLRIRHHLTARTNAPTTLGIYFGTC